MDSLVESLSSSLGVSEEVNDTSRPHPRFGQYKTLASHSDQESRRQSLLKQQKQRRRDVSNRLRHLGDGDFCCSDDDDDDGEESRGNENGHSDCQEDMTSGPMGGHDSDDEARMDCTAGVTKGLFKKKKKKAEKSWRHQLMLSEWLVDVPEDFQTEWLMVVCPVGHRSLVVAAKGYTAAYTRGGYCVNRFPSLLPGGSRKTTSNSMDCTVLDCIYVAEHRTFFVLDVMCWHGHPVYDSETEFRFFWLKSKLSEADGVSKKSSVNPFCFVALDAFPCQAAVFAEVLSSRPPLQVDGLLFYHRRVHYNPGRTPLVGWLKADMLPNLLGITAAQVFLEQCVADGNDAMETESKKRTKNASSLNGDEADTMDVSSQRTRGKRKGKPSQRAEGDSMDVGRTENACS